MKKIRKHTSRKVRRKRYSFLEEINKVVSDYLHALQAVNAPVKQQVSVSKNYK